MYLFSEILRMRQRLYKLLWRSEAHEQSDGGQVVNKPDAGGKTLLHLSFKNKNVFHFEDVWTELGHKIINLFLLRFVLLHHIHNVCLTPAWLCRTLLIWLLKQQQQQFHLVKT